MTPISRRTGNTNGFQHRAVQILVGVGAALLLASCNETENRQAATENADVAVVQQQPEAAPVASKPTMQIYKSPTCGCCGEWVNHIEASGFPTEVFNTDAMGEVKERLGINPNYHSCHTAVIGDYVFEGHIPAEVIERFLKEKPDALGLAVPGMPVGSPGMEMGDHRDAYDVFIIRRDGMGAVYEHVAGTAGTP